MLPSSPPSCSAASESGGMAAAAASAAKGERGSSSAGADGERAGCSSLAAAASARGGGGASTRCEDGCGRLPWPTPLGELSASPPLPRRRRRSSSSSLGMSLSPAPPAAAAASAPAVAPSPVVAAAGRSRTYLYENAGGVPLSPGPSTPPRSHFVASPPNMMISPSLSVTEPGSMRLRLTKVPHVEADESVCDPSASAEMRACTRDMPAVGAGSLSATPPGDVAAIRVSMRRSSTPSSGLGSSSGGWPRDCL
mmetsp:Transcript_3877/g.12121  ORF Transcript_3877/g.12121 Transcript_3877/m.12121 type:complete len:252 (-) Transcript_3877:254-1009(-)